MDALGQARRMAYDAKGNRISDTDALGNVTRRVYDARDRVVEERGPLPEQVTTYGYDAVGNRVRESLPHGQVLMHRYDAANRRTRSEDNLNGTVPALLEALTYDASDNVLERRNGRGLVSTYGYDQLNRVTQETQPLARIRRYRYNVHGDQVREEGPRGGITSHVYDALGRKVQSTLADGSQRTFSYDAVGNRITQVDGLGHLTRYGYDDLNRKVSQVDPILDVPIEQRWTYDAQGNELTHTDRRGIVTSKTYDLENRLLSESRDGLLRVRHSYDALGNLIERQDANGNRTRYGYDAAQRKVSQVQAQGSPEQSGQAWSYTPSGDVASHSDGVGRISTLSYDLRRRLIAEVNGAGQRTQYHYDENGNRTRTIPAIEARAISYEYDDADRLVAVRDGLNNRTQYAYDAADNRVSHSNAGGHQTRYEYDLMNRQTAKVKVDGSRWSYQYDFNGNPSQVQTPRGIIQQNRYDAWNRLIESRWSGPVPSITVQVQYDANGNLTRISEVGAEGERATVRRYDTLDRLEWERDAWGQELRYGYDAQGNRTRRSDGAQDTSYVFDGQDRPTAVQSDLGSIRLDWYADGRLQAIRRPSGSTSSYRYDGAGRIERIIHSRAGATILSLEYAYDANGNRTQQRATGDGQEPTIDYRYDNAERLIEVTHSDRRISYTLNAVGNRTREQVQSTATPPATLFDASYSYDPRDRLINRTAAGSSTTYQYDADGNRTQEATGSSTRTSAWDAKGRLTSITSASGTITYSYDAQDQRIQSQQGSQQSRYRYDAGSLYAELDALNNVQRRYQGIPLAGVSGAALVQSPAAAGTWASPGAASMTLFLGLSDSAATPLHRTYLHDALATPLAIENQDGTIASRTRYDAWGNIEAEQVIDTRLNARPNRIGYTGYTLDREASQGQGSNGAIASAAYYAKARYYDAGNALFTSQDPWQGDIQQPLSLNPYLYAYANPNRYIDPTGKYAEAGHYYTTYYVALRAGFSNEEAQKLAFYSQLPDEVDDLDAIGSQSNAFLSDWGTAAVNAWLDATPSVIPVSAAPSRAASRRNDVQSDLHSLLDSTGPEQTALTLAAMRKAGGNLATTGLLIHRLGDSFAHCPDRGKCFETGWGHSAASLIGSDPDVIQNSPEQYLAYVETLAGALGEQQGMSGDRIKALRASMRAELQDVAGIKRFDGPAIPAWEPSGWMQSAPMEVYDAINAQRRRPNEQLQALSEQALRQKLLQHGANGGYSPEALPIGLDIYGKYVPYVWSGRTLDQALADFTQGKGQSLSKQEVLEAIARVGQLVNAQRAFDHGEPAVVIEAIDGAQSKIQIQGKN